MRPAIIGEIKIILKSSYLIFGCNPSAGVCDLQTSVDTLSWWCFANSQFLLVLEVFCLGSGLRCICLCLLKICSDFPASWWSAGATTTTDSKCGCKYPLIKAASQHFDVIVAVFFHIQFAGLQSQNKNDLIWDIMTQYLTFLFKINTLIAF